MPVCTMCGQGFFFRNNQCVTCIHNNAWAGCAQCDPFNNYQCILCLENFHMTKDQVCEDDEMPVHALFFLRSFEQMVLNLLLISLLI